MRGIQLLTHVKTGRTVVGSSKRNSRMVTTDISFSRTTNQSLTRGTQAWPEMSAASGFLSGGELIALLREYLHDMFGMYGCSSRMTSELREEQNQKT